MFGGQDERTTLFSYWLEVIYIYISANWNGAQNAVDRGVQHLQHFILMRNLWKSRNRNMSQISASKGSLQKQLNALATGGRRQSHRFQLLMS